MSYDDINNEFQPGETVDHGDFSYTPEGFADEGESAFIRFKDGRVFRGVCKDLKPWSGEMVFPNFLSGKPVSCILEKGGYWTGIVPEEDGKFSYYQNGLKGGYKSEKPLNLSSRTALAMALLALVGGSAVLELEEAEQSDEAAFVKETAHEEAAHNVKQNYYTKDTPYYMRSMSREAFERKFGTNMKNECSAEQNRRIDRAKVWLLRNIGSVANELNNWYFNPRNTPYLQEIFFNLRFPQNLTPHVLDIYFQNTNPRVYCPGKMMNCWVQQPYLSLKTPKIGVK
jgi:hypothetical protein